jgi:hypothetical protein
MQWIFLYIARVVVVVIVEQLDLQLLMQSMSITTKAVSSNPVHGEVYSIQYCVIKFVSDLRQLGGFHRVFRFPLPIKLAATKYRVAEILLKVALNIITLTFILQIFHIKGKHLYFWLWVYLIKVIPQTRSFVVKAFY